MGTTTPIRGLYKPARGEVDWDQQVNSNFDNLDATANTSYVNSGDATTLSNAKAYTDSAVSGISSPVTSVAGKTGAVLLVESDIGNLVSDLAAKAPLASPALTGTPTAPTQTSTDNSTNIATTAFVQSAVAAIVPPVTSVAGKTGAVLLVESDIGNLVNDLAAKAPLASPVLTGTPTAPTPIAGDNSTNIATTAFVENALSGFTPSGYPSVVAHVLQKVETGSDPSLLSFTPPSTVGLYRLSVVLSASQTSSPTGFSCSIAYQDSNHHAQSQPISMFKLGQANPLTNFTSGGLINFPVYLTLIIDVDNSGTPIVVSTTFAGTSITYTASAVIERLI